MKKLTIVFIMAAFVFNGHMMAQTKKSSKPATTPKPAASSSTAASTEATDIQEFDINGVKVILKSATNSVISAQLFITGGVSNYAKGKDGVEQLMLLTMTDGGSQKYPKDAYHSMMERKGIYINGSAGYDYSTMSLRTLVQNWNDAWDMFSDVVMQPSWDAQSFDQMKNQSLAGLQQAEADPDSRIRDMSIMGTFKGKNYEKKPDGTTETVSGITMDDVKNQYKTDFKARKLMLVVVGNVSADDLKAKVTSTLAKLPQGTPDVFKSEPVVVATPTVVTEQREIATNYIRGVFSAPQQATREAVAMRVAVSMLDDRLFVEIRTKRNLSYAPSAAVSQLFSPYSFVYVSTTEPDTAVQVMMDEIRKIKKDGFSEKELLDKKAGYLTNYYLAQETNDAQAITLGVAELMKDWHYALEFRPMVQSLTLKEVNDAFRKYASAISWYYLGDEGKVNKSIFTSKL